MSSRETVDVDRLLRIDRAADVGQRHADLIQRRTTGDQAALIVIERAAQRQALPCSAAQNAFVAVIEAAGFDRQAALATSAPAPLLSNASLRSTEISPSLLESVPLSRLSRLSPLTPKPCQPDIKPF